MSAAVADEEEQKVENERAKKTIRDLVKPAKMRCLAREYGSFPSENRVLIWRTLLWLPENHTPFRDLVERAIEAELPENWKRWISERDMMRPSTMLSLNRTLRWLITWSPELGCLEFLPRFILPFATIFGSSPVSSFEASATAIVNWGDIWLEMCTEPPFQLMCLIEELLVKFSPGVLKVLKQHQINVVSFMWPLFETGFATVLREKRWRQLWDHIVCNKPAFYVSAGVAFVCCLEPQVQETSKTAANFNGIFSKEYDMDMKVLLRKSYEIFDMVLNWPQNLMAELTPLSVGTYVSLKELLEVKSNISKEPREVTIFKNETKEIDLQDELPTKDAAQDLASEIMSALQFSQKTRDAVDSWKGAQLSDTKEKRKEAPTKPGRST